MARSREQEDRWFKIAGWLLGIGILLILIGALLQREWPSGGALVAILGSLVAALLLWFSRRQRQE